jgi:hypothetical protein
MKKKYTSVLSFSKQELFNTGQLTIEQAGVSIPVDSLEEFNSKAHESFGFLTGNDGNKYFPDIAASDLMPKEEDFVKAPFRLLSATVVAGGTWRATNFGAKESVLKSSMQKLLGKPVFYDHDTDLMNWTGFVESVKWTPKTKSKNGQEIPAGIDGILALDGKTNPKLARGVLMKAIFSNSVTVLFEWEPSHEYDSEYEFQDHIGRYGADGKMVTRNVTKILDYHESSLVWLGADPFAKLIDSDGDLVNIDESSVVSFSKETNEKDKQLYTDEKKYSVNSCLNKSVCISLTREGYNFGVPQSQSKDEIEMKKEVLELLAKVFGYDDATKISEADVAKVTLLKDGQVVVASEEHESFKTEAGKVATLEGEKTTLESEKTELENTIEANKPLVTLGESYLSLKREEVKRLYKASVGEKVDEKVLGLFDKAASDELEGLLAQYTKTATLKFSGKCGKCGSEEFSFRSSLSTEELSSGNTEVVEEESGSFDSIYEKHTKKNLF